MLAIVAAIGIIKTAATGVGLTPATRGNVAMNGPTKKVYFNNTTGQTIRLQYLCTACIQTIQDMDARSNLTSRDVDKMSTKEKHEWEAELKLAANGGKAAPGGEVHPKFKKKDEHERSHETDRARGSEQSQKFHLGLDEERRNRFLDLVISIPPGFDFQMLPLADHGLWYMRIWDENKTTLRPLGEHHVGFQTKFIEITPDFRIKPMDEIPSAFLPEHQCRHCLKIEDRSEEAMEKLANADIRYNNRTYAGVRNAANEVIFKAADGHQSYIAALKPLIGEQNPFVLFKLGKVSQRWFDSKSDEKKNDLLERLALPTAPGFDLGTHLQLVKSPEGTPSPFSIAGEPIQIIGKCPYCKKRPNRTLL